jgi:hypothetical protein
MLQEVQQMKRAKKANIEQTRVYSTRDGALYVSPSDVLFSAKAKEDIRIVREIFENARKVSEPSSDTAASSKQRD